MTHSLRLALQFTSCAFLVLGACDPGAGGPSSRGDAPPGDDAGPDAPPALPSTPGHDTGADADTDTDTDTDTGGDTGSTDTPDAPVRFIALGDGGQGNSGQYAVAAAIETVCAANGCDFAIYLGDNIYSDGVSSVDDSQFEEKFEAPYANLSFPFYMALGNHDWGNGHEGTEYQVEYTAHSSKWTMPDQYYAHTQGDVSFFVVDSQAIKDGDGAPQEEWLSGAMAESTSRWNIAYGHHPYLSNGDHGNTGGEFADFFDRNLCGKVDIYFAGHDHDLQWPQPVCGTEFIVSGAAAGTRDLGSSSNPTLFETATKGFMWVEIVGDTMTGVFYDSDGSELFRRVVTK
jgi:tartrate-resistant acid phosphatase type 5